MRARKTCWPVLAVLTLVPHLVFSARLVNRLLGGSRDVEEDAKLSPAGLMSKRGYEVQVHHVTTEDDYILEIDRMPFGVHNGTRTVRPPVLLVHGVVSSAADFVINKPDQSVGMEQTEPPALRQDMFSFLSFYGIINIQWS
ncbi:hypothetical protein HPB48_009907 [Haemaphysalis longicornis]|uniref:Partial AB-hydrolase lipase domain-containing protein n=1 Tax=Haemaphysalis longicornis TaxID=44386 RepID=A0A9J6GZI1_HAELO|nr:hypothetical protein HPB48_009907 [Haemaphysalis longicornis]